MSSKPKFRLLGTIKYIKINMHWDIHRQQDQELDELSASVERIGGVGLTIHDELIGQDRIIDELGRETDSISNRLDSVQKKVSMVMKNASAKTQIMMIVFLLVLFIILFVLVFLT